MGKRIFRLLVGIFLIALGGLFLLDTFGFLPVEVELVFSVGLLAIGFTFILHSFKEEESWRWFIPGGIVLTLGAIGLLGYFEIMKDEFLGALVLAGFAFSFLPAFFLKERKDWAIYPSWFLLVLSGTYRFRCPLSFPPSVQEGKVGSLSRLVPDPTRHREFQLNFEDI